VKQKNLFAMIKNNPDGILLSYFDTTFGPLIYAGGFCSAIIYYRGEGVPEDKAEAIKRWR
ncbi:MAG: hypothetical protein LBL95_03010, partial [Deltaproteobacteria bacterium]|nr:hypothetical protein [Deltaproteobacteria bacterium]